MAFQARDFLAPRYWPTWLGFGGFWLLTRLPFPVVMRISRGLGLLTYSLLASRRRITLINLRLAFPALSDKERKLLAQDAFRHVGMAMGETAWTWFRSVDQIGPVDITGTEHVDAALARGKGVILLQAHFTLLELCAAVVGIRWPMRAVYDPPKNPLFAAFLLHQRNRHMEGMIDNRGIREMVRCLRGGGIVWYSPDQSVSVSHGGVPTRYFDQPVLTTSGTARIMRMTGATIIPFIPERKPDGGGYAFRFQSPVALESDDLVEATQQVNDFLEAQVRTQPEQYLWAHKRFKPPLARAHRPLPMTPPWRYRGLVRLLSPLLAGYTVWRAWKEGGWRYWWQRLGVYSLPRDQAAPPPPEVQLWVHAASVGEVLTVLPLVREWQARTGDRVLLTTGTPTGAAVLEKQAIAGIRHQYLPVDFPGACQRFVNQLPVQTGWIVETEIWPWLYASCERAGITLTIINGRLSSRTSTQSKGLLRSSYHRALANVRVLARSQQDVDNFIALGTPPAHVTLIGNLKYTDAPSEGVTQPPINRDYVLAASTHDNEERQLAELWLQRATKDHLLVIVPRHPERAPAILRELTALGAKVSQRSSHQPPASGEQIYLADTLGEMQAWYRFASACFVGGSLISRGGHNMLEPARYACPVIVGPHTENFDDIMQLLRQADAIQVAQTAAEVIRFLVDVAHGHADYRMMASRARQVALDSQNVLQRYLDALESRPTMD